LKLRFGSGDAILETKLDRLQKFGKTSEQLHAAILIVKAACILKTPRVCAIPKELQKVLLRKKWRQGLMSQQASNRELYIFATIVVVTYTK